ncbi:class I adenylate-forming enzyme family protein [Leucobacter sp. BZR 635]
MRLKHLLWESPAAGTHHDCLGDERGMLTYAEVDARARAAAEQFAELGIGEGDVVGIMLENSVELLLGILGAWLLGAVATPINPTFTGRELQYQLADSTTKLLLTSAAVLPADTALEVPRLNVSELRTTATGTVPTPVTPPSQLALLIYTSGSTGQPKGVMLDHANLCAMASGLAEHVELTAADRALVVLPMFHVNAICVSWLAPTVAGGSTSVMQRFSPQALIDAVARVQPTYFSVVPAILARLVELPAEVESDFRSVRLVICGAAPVSAELLQLSGDRFGLHILEGYGLTESTCASACIPLRGPHKLGTVGPAISGQEIKLVDARGAAVPAGERGEVWISGPTVMRGYFGRPEATADAIVDGWLRTGDVGVLDADGYLKIVDRIKDMIIRGGENLYPKEIETHLASHPAVLESAVVGAAHPSLGEVPVAYVVPQPGAGVSSAELLAHCAAGLMKIKVPARLEIVPELPRNPVGKIDKPELRRRTPPVAAPAPVGAAG